MKNLIKWGSLLSLASAFSLTNNVPAQDVLSHSPSLPISPQTRQLAVDSKKLNSSRVFSEYTNAVADARLAFNNAIISNAFSTVTCSNISYLYDKALGLSTNYSNLDFRNGHIEGETANEYNAGDALAHKLTRAANQGYPKSLETALENEGIAITFTFDAAPSATNTPQINQTQTTSITTPPIQPKFSYTNFPFIVERPGFTAKGYNLDLLETNNFPKMVFKDSGAIIYEDLSKGVAPGFFHNNCGNHYRDETFIFDKDVSKEFQIFKEVRGFSKKIGIKDEKGPFKSYNISRDLPTGESPRVIIIRTPDYCTFYDIQLPKEK